MVLYWSINAIADYVGDQIKLLEKILIYPVILILIPQENCLYQYCDYLFLMQVRQLGSLKSGNPKGIIKIERPYLMLLVKSPPSGGHVIIYTAS